MKIQNFTIHSNSGDFDQLLYTFDGKDPFMTGGHGIVKAREGSGTRKVPDWVHDRGRLREILLRSFPLLFHPTKGEESRFRAGRWLRVLYLYYYTNDTATGIAEEMRISVDSVNGILRSIRRAVAGLRANGRGRLGGKRGRPKGTYKRY